MTHNALPAFERAMIDALRAAFRELFEGKPERQREIAAVLDRIEADMRRERAPLERATADRATRSGAANSLGGVKRRAVPDAPDAVIAEDGQSVLLIDPADDPRWWFSFRLPIWAAYDGDKAQVRVTPDCRNIVVAREPGGRPELFTIPESVQLDLRRHVAFDPEGDAA